MAGALVLEGPRRLRLRDVDAPALRSRKVRLRALVSGVSHGTELNLYRGTSAFADRVFDRVLLGEQWHDNRLDMVSGMGAWGAPHRAHPAWDRARVMQTVAGLLASRRVRVDALPVRHFPFEHAVEAYAWLDAHPNEAVKVALTYDGSNPAAGGER